MSSGNDGIGFTVQRFLQNDVPEASVRTRIINIASRIDDGTLIADFEIIGTRRTMDLVRYVWQRIDTMERKKIDEILLPYKEGIPLHPRVRISDRIIHAVELMVNNNMTYIAVIKNNRPIGMLRLEDAFRKLGLQIPDKK